MGVNVVIFGGRLIKKPEIKWTEKGKSVTNLVIVNNSSYRSSEGKRVESVEYMRVVVWGKRGEAVHKHLDKGSELTVEGRYTSRSWEGRDRKQHYTSEVIAHAVHFGPKSKPENHVPETLNENLSEEVPEFNL